MQTEVVCSDCSEPVELHRQDNRALVVSCGCETRGVKVTQKLPEGWR